MFIIRKFKRCIMRWQSSQAAGTLLNSLKGQNLQPWLARHILKFNKGQSEKHCASMAHLEYLGVANVFVLKRMWQDHRNLPSCTRLLEQCNIMGK